MQRVVFEQGMMDIYAAFGKRLPDADTLDAIWKRVQDYPDAFMAFAVGRIGDEEKLPQNLGRYLCRVLWAAYMGQHPENHISMQPPGCARCMAGNPGYVRAWKNGEASVFRCVCHPDERGVLPAPTDAELMEHGYFLQPFPGRLDTPKAALPCRMEQLEF